MTNVLSNKDFNTHIEQMKFDRKIQQLEQIIEKKEIVPKIVNESSKFVVVTYWWGNKNINRNLARPCLSFYEDLLLKPFTLLQNYTSVIAKLNETCTNINWLKFLTTNTNELKIFYVKKITDYVLEKFKDLNMPKSRNAPEVDRAVRDILKPFIIVVDDLLKATSGLIRQFPSAPKNLQNDLKQAIRPFIFSPCGLIKLLEYRPPKTYNEMIKNWEIICERAGCNHLAVEYPEFAQPGGYQLAINAKPLFIKKALDACMPRAVVYIDGDMTMNRYPEIFDMEGIDYMARNWHIDPRSSYKHVEGDIVVDPYTFETSGGIMYFSQSPEAKNLLAKWINESAKFLNSGKADDRIISLIFNSYRLLAPMKIIQLPVEFLWLTLDYDDTISDELVDRERIYVEHPECLTSEDTAASSGAALNRQPKYYQGIETVYPRAERLYEYSFFPSMEVRNNFGPWLEYVGSTEYLEEYVSDFAGDNPFTVTPFVERFGDKNDIYDNNMEAINSQTNTFSNNANYVILNEEGITIPAILAQLVKKREVRYIPINTTRAKKAAFQEFCNNPKYNRIEFAFFDTGLNLVPEKIFQYNIDLKQPILFRPAEKLITLLALQTDFNEIQKALENNYQFLSQIRVHILKGAQLIGGGGNMKFDRNTNDALELLYNNTVSGRRKTMRKRKNSRKTRKN